MREMGHAQCTRSSQLAHQINLTIRLKNFRSSANRTKPKAYRRPTGFKGQRSKVKGRRSEDFGFRVSKFGPYQNTTVKRMEKLLDDDVPRSSTESSSKCKLWWGYPIALVAIAMTVVLTPWTMSCPVSYVEMPEMTHEVCTFTNIACSDGCSSVFPSCGGLDEDELMNDIACCMKAEEGLCSTTNMSVVLHCENSHWRTKVHLKYPWSVYQRKFTVSSDSQTHSSGFCTSTSYSCAYEWYHKIGHHVDCNHYMIFDEIPWTDYFGWVILSIAGLATALFWTRA